MELRQLRYLVALAEEGQFTRAASRLSIAQPALSQQIQKLEAQVGMALVDRGGRQISLTQAGELLLDRARRMLAEAEAAQAELAQLAGLQTGRLTIGVSLTLGSLDFFGALASFHGRFPGVELAVSEGLSMSICDRLRRDALDLGLVTIGHGREVRGLQVRSVASEDLVCIVSPDHRLARYRSTTLGALQRESFAMFGPGATIRSQVEEALTLLGTAANVAFSTDDVTRMRDLVSRGLAVAVLPRSDAERPGSPVSVLDLRDNGLQHTVFLIWRDGSQHSPAAREFIQTVLAQ